MSSECRDLALFAGLEITVWLGDSLFGSVWRERETSSHRAGMG